MNSPESLIELHQLASSASNETEQAVYAAELMREVGLKCISFNGVCLLHQGEWQRANLTLDSADNQLFRRFPCWSPKYHHQCTLN